ncbi:hypothetical protein ACFW9L_07195 [Streptomyces sp. NPDC059517]|uniref:hypothetical protein n=1 Tax=Streptomyces sp. NPDC059517 TaxID=3346855 RepID=UPI0036914B1E
MGTITTTVAQLTCNCSKWSYISGSSQGLCARPERDRRIGRQGRADQRPRTFGLLQA